MPSITKSLVDAAAGRLIGEEKLNWEFPVSQMSPGFSPHPEHSKDYSSPPNSLQMKRAMENYCTFLQSHASINLSSCYFKGEGFFWAALEAIKKLLGVGSEAPSSPIKQKCKAIGHYWASAIVLHNSTDAGCD